MVPYFAEREGFTKLGRKFSRLFRHSLPLGDFPLADSRLRAFSPRRRDQRSSEICRVGGLHPVVDDIPLEFGEEREHAGQCPATWCGEVERLAKRRETQEKGRPEFRKEQEPPCQTEARNRCGIMRKARSKKQRPLLLAELERRDKELRQF